MTPTPTTENSPTSSIDTSQTQAIPIVINRNTLTNNLQPSQASPTASIGSSLRTQQPVTEQEEHDTTMILFCSYSRDVLEPRRQRLLQTD